MTEGTPVAQLACHLLVDPLPQHEHPWHHLWENMAALLAAHTLVIITTHCPTSLKVLVQIPPPWAPDSHLPCAHPTTAVTHNPHSLILWQLRPHQERFHLGCHSAAAPIILIATQPQPPTQRHLPHPTVQRRPAHTPHPRPLLLQIDAPSIHPTTAVLVATPRSATMNQFVPHNVHSHPRPSDRPV